MNYEDLEKEASLLARGDKELLESILDLMKEAFYMGMDAEVEDD